MTLSFRIVTKTLLAVIWALAAFPVLLMADGIPVDPETGKITVPHTFVNLNADQVEEVDSLGTLTFTGEQWIAVRKVAPTCPKRLGNVLPVTFNDCTCHVSGVYGIAVARNLVAVLHDSWDESVLAWKIWQAGLQRNSLELRVDHRGQFYYRGALVPFQLLLKAISSEPEQSREERSKTADARKPFVMVSIPFGMDRGAATLKLRIDRLYKTAGAGGWETPGDTEP